MPNYDLSTPGAIAASARLARKQADREPNQSGYNAAWLHGYADALVDAAKQLEAAHKQTDAVSGKSSQDQNTHQNQRRNCTYER